MISSSTALQSTATVKAMGSTGTARLSGALLVADVNDFLTPSNACVLPLGGGALASAPLPAPPVAAPAGSVLAPIVPAGKSDGTATRATVTLSDCLACSGCVTSAETVLLSSESVDKLRRVVINAKPEHRSAVYAVVALSQQAVASIAVAEGMPLGVCARKLATFLRVELGFDAVVDLAFARHLALVEAAHEFIERYRSGAGVVVSSACPGWVTYAEKTQGDGVLASVSRVRSPQAVAGALVKKLLAPGDERRVWFSCIMQCHDKKIEASREEFSSVSAEGAVEREVECVLTASELMDIVRERNYDLSSTPESPLDSRFASVHDPSSFGSAVGSGSGGYADHVLRVAAKELLGVSLPSTAIRMDKASRSGDMKSVTVKSADGTKQLRFATAYGFRSLQSILRKMRRGESEFDYIELMACPGGCNNGGGQLALAPIAPTDSPKQAPATAKQAASELLERVDAKFLQAPRVPDPLVLPHVQDVYRRTIGGEPGSKQAKSMLYGSIVSRKAPTTGPASLAW